MPNYWMVKSEPGEFSYTDLETQGWTHWDGVRNFQARNNLKAMAVGDWVLVYHSVTDKQIVGIAKVAKTAYPDPTDETGKWLAVRLEPHLAFTQPVTLEQVKAEPALAEIPLIKQSRLSVMPLDKTTFEKLLSMGKTRL